MWAFISLRSLSSFSLNCLWMIIRKPTVSCDLFLLIKLFTHSNSEYGYLGEPDTCLELATGSLLFSVKWQTFPRQEDRCIANLSLTSIRIKSMSKRSQCLTGQISACSLAYALVIFVLSHSLQRLFSFPFPKATNRPLPYQPWREWVWGDSNKSRF